MKNNLSVHRIKRCQPLLGTFVEITLEGAQSEAWLHQAAGKTFHLIESVQKLMSFHDPDSDVSRLNQCGYISPLQVHPWTRQVLERAVRLSETTDGAFDITLVPRLVASGLLPRHGRAQGLSEAGRWAEIEFPGENTVFFRRPLKIDLGGIAKGFAVDKAIDYLASRGLTRAVVNAGGDLRVHGSSQLEIAVRHPAMPHRDTIPAVMLRPAVATSAAYFVRMRTGVTRANHIIHPRTGRMLRTNDSVSVFAPTCVQADALTKAVLLAPQPVWNRVLAENDSLALFITRKGEQVLYPN
ncbi:MAG: FAD:protein FMN transferase [Verrucomicrobiales bacterium]|nr:FAD:protein FMN transferase [Verrucomicrobiales bacterium]